MRPVNSPARDQGGEAHVPLPNGETRTYLQDGDEVIFRTSCRREGYATIGFGDCAGTILPAINY